MKKLFLALFILSFSLLKAQTPQVNLQLNWEIPFTFANQALTIEHDQTGKNYIYVAGKEQGLLIYDISSTPNKVKTITKNQLDTLDVMSVTQHGNYLYLALGNSFTNPEFGGMAVIDVSTPTSAVITDIYKQYTGTKSGGGIVKVEGNYAYFGAMQEGLIVFDVSDKNNISKIAQYKPNNNFPDPNPDAKKYNARGMAVKNNIVYLCYDAGGVRIINTVDKQNIKETGRFSNPTLNGKPRAYNNVVLNDTLLYVAVDYAGMEVLNIKDTSNIQLLSWWNPWGISNWFASRGHSNEIQFDASSNLIFMSTGKSDINVVSVANPSAPDSVAIFGGINNSQGTWGLGLYQDKIYAGYIFVPLCIPFCSNWGGVKEISWNISTSTNTNHESNFSVFPNPANSNVTITLKEKSSGVSTISIYDINGKLIQKETITEGQNSFRIDTQNLSEGLYFIMIVNNEKTNCSKLMIQK